MTDDKAVEVLRDFHQKMDSWFQVTYTMCPECIGTVGCDTCLPAHRAIKKVRDFLAEVAR